jgi:hypothetical protein
MQVRLRTLVTTALAGLLGTACLVEVHKVKDPGPAFDKARAQALRASRDGGQPGSLVVLAYDPDDGELARVAVPLWLCKKMKGEIELDGDDAAERALGRLRWEDLEKAGAGVLVEVEDEDGEQVLVWLE